MANKTVLEVLQGALKILRAKSRWTKGAFARNSEGESLHSGTCDYGADATCFCALGAINQAAGSCNVADQAGEALARVLPNRYDGSVPTWNDARRRTVEQVREMFKKAIAAEKQAAVST